MTKQWKFAVVAALVAAFGALVVVGLGLPAEVAVPRASQCAVYTEQGCAKYVVASGGEIEIQSGGELETLAGATVDFQEDVVIGGDLKLDGTFDLNAVMTGAADLEHLFFPTVVISDIAYASATGSTGAVATIADGETWLVWAVFISVTTDFDCTGDDATLIVGDGADTDGFVVLADAELQVADTEQTGSPAGWQGLVAATMGVYLDGAVSSAPHIYAPRGSAETIDYLISEGSGDTLTAGRATIIVVYTRIQ